MTITAIRQASQDTIVVIILAAEVVIGTRLVTPGKRIITTDITTTSTEITTTNLRALNYIKLTHFTSIISA